MIQELEKTVSSQKIDNILQKQLERSSETTREIWETVEDYDNYFITCGGKRLRIMIPFILAKGLDVELTDEQLIELFSPIELGHGTSLILDDVMDGDRKRRGEKTPHEKFNEHFDEEKAESYAILDTFHLQSKIERLSFKMDFLDRQQQIEAVELVGKSIVRLCRGQMLDIAAEDMLETLKSDDEFNYTGFYQDIIERKTAPLFEAGPKMLEVVTGEDYSELVQYMEALAKSFQIRDDVLDISGGTGKVSLETENNKTGKDQFSDIENGIVTPPIYHALETLRNEKSLSSLIEGKNGFQETLDKFKDQKNLLESVLKSDNPKEKELRLAGKIVEKAGGLEKAQAEAEKYSEKAVEHLRDSNLDQERKEMLEKIAEFAGKRKT